MTIIETIKTWIDQIKAMIETFGADYPWVIFVAIVLLPGFGFPVSALLIIAGVVWGATIQSCLIALAAVALNIIWTHLVASGIAKPLVTRFLGNRWKQWRELPSTSHLRLTVIMRVTPGLPLCVQNYILSLIGVPLTKSLLVALPVTGLYVFGFVLTGGAIFEGQFGLVLVGVSLLIVAGVLVRWLSRRIKATPNDLI